MFDQEKGRERERKSPSHPIKSTLDPGPPPSTTITTSKPEGKLERGRDERSTLCNVCVGSVGGEERKTPLGRREREREREREGGREREALM